MLPTTAQIIDITLGGRGVKLYFSFRAWRILGVNPMRPAEVAEFLGAIDVEKAAAWIEAGIKGHQALVRRLAEQDGEQPPPVCSEVWDQDRIMDLIDVTAFGEIVEAIGAVNKTADGIPAEQPGNE
jgi:hypothetical protein